MIKYFYRFLIVTLIFTQQVLANDKQQVVIIHSSYQGYPWTDSIQKGIEQEFSQSSVNHELWIEYIDVKRIAEPEYFSQLRALFSIKYKRSDIDLFIVSDNEAYDFLMGIRDTLFPRTPVVFTAFNGYQPDTLKGKSLITGVIEENSFTETIDIALQLHPATKKIVFLLPHALPVRMAWVKDIAEQYAQQFEVIKLTSHTLASIDDELRALGNDILVIPLNSFHLKTGNYLSFVNFVNHLATTGNYPVYGVWDVALGHGIVGGKLVSGEMQGKKSAQLALQILSGKSFEALPLVENSPNQFMFDWIQLQRFNINIDDLPEHSVIINKLPSFYDKYTLLVWLVSLIILILLALITSLSINIIYRKQSQSQLKLAASVFTHARESIVISDAAGLILDVNDTFTYSTGYSREEAIGNTTHILKSGLQSPEFYVDMWDALIKEGYWSGEIWNKRKNGDVYAEIKTISAVADERGIITHYVALGNDITLIKEHQAQLEHIAHYDRLTHLPNRSLLSKLLSNSMTHCARNKQSLAVIFLDLDGFKAINDTYGHDVGDKLLILLSTRLKEVLREGDSLARVGGDEFVAILTDLPNDKDCIPVFKLCLLAASKPAIIDGIVLTLSASIGVTLYPQDSVNADQLIRHADQAMYKAKQLGKNRYHLFDISQNDAVKAQRESLEAIRCALDNHQFVLYYQPKINMKIGKVIGYEALIRWQHPERGLLNPIEFLPVIENHAMMIEVGEWVIDTALKQISEWQITEINLPLNISVNIAAVQLQQPNFIQTLRSLLACHSDVEPRFLELEVLETSALDDLLHVSDIMKDCMALGVKFALDDFGTGYSSLTYLRRLPGSLIKIDQSFVRDMLNDEDDLAIVKGVIALAQSFKRDVIAEGVETIEHGTALLQLGCDLAQGYGIAKPMPASKIPVWVDNWHPDVSWQTLQREEN